jgi:hypothetical protein
MHNFLLAGIPIWQHIAYIGALVVFVPTGYVYHYFATRKDQNKSKN